MDFICPNLGKILVNKRKIGSVEESEKGIFTILILK